MTCKKCQQETRACELHAYAGRCEDCYNEPKAVKQLNIQILSLLGKDTVKAMLDVKKRKKVSHDSETTPESPEIG